VNLGHLLVSNNRDAEARSVTEKALKAAQTAQEQKMARGLLEQMRRRQSGQGESNP
jgi:hypothetical protein